MTPPAAEPDEDGFTELRDPHVPRLDAVAAAANGTPFFIAKQDASGLFDPEFVRDLLAKNAPPDPPQESVTMTGSPAAVADLMARMHGAPMRKAEASTASMNDRPDSDFAYIEPGGHKDESGKTTPRSLRHFPIYDAAHVRNALSRAPQSPFGDRAMPKIRAAAKRFGIDVAKADGTMDDLDPTVVLAEPDEAAPGDPADPGSPAWEAIDAATARKWTAILARAKNALCAMADRELMEAMVADPDDAGSAFDIQDAECAIDYAIGVLAAFAVGEQSEADLGAEAMDALLKSLGSIDTAALDTVEALAPIRKAGRVLSAANEAALRDAAAGIQRVLASLPEPTPPAGEPVAKQEDAMSETATTVPHTPAAPITKDDGKPAQVAVYDRNGNLAGTVDPGDITPIADAPAADTPNDGQSPEVAVPGTQTVQSPPVGADADVMKASIEAGFGPLTEVLSTIAKQLGEQTGLADVVKGLQEQVTHLASMPDDRRSPLLNGGTGIPGAAPRTSATDDRVVALEKAVAEATTDAQREQAQRDLFFAKTAARFPAPPGRR